MSERRLIQICGTQRSGSTMLDAILGNSQDAFSTGEVFAYYRPHRKHHFHFDCTCGAADCPVWKRLGQPGASEFHAAAMKSLDVSSLIDSSKDLNWTLDSTRWAERAGLNICRVVIWKEPIDLAFSYLKRGRKGVAWRNEFVGYYSRFLALGLPFIAVSLNKLQASPATYVPKVCDALGVSYRPGQERFWEKRHHILFGSPSIKRAVDKGQSEFKPAGYDGEQFVKERVELTKAIEQDKDLQRVKKILEQAELSFTQSEKTGRTYFCRPRWYWKRRLWHVRKRFLPEPTPVGS